MRPRWDRIIAVILILISPVILNWLWENLYIGPFRRIGAIGRIAHYPEAKALALLGVLLLGIVLIVKVLRGASGASETPDQDL